MKKIYLTYCLLFYFVFTLHAQTSYPPMVITAGTPFSLQVAGASRYQGVANFGELYDPVSYGKGIQISRAADQGDNAFHLSFIRAGQKIAGLGFLRNSNTFAIQNYGTNITTSGIFITELNNVGIGTVSPSGKFEVSTTNAGEQSSLGIYQSSFLPDNNPINEPTTKLMYNWYGLPKASINFHRGSSSLDGFMSFSTSDNNIPRERMRIDARGNISIGDIDAKGYKLAIAGSMIAERVKVKLQVNWPDYVFHDDYELPSLKGLEFFINKHKHLPLIPSAKEIAQQGIDIGDMQQRQMQKIEELTLYLIDQNKKLETQQQLILALNDRLKELEGKQSK